MRLPNPRRLAAADMYGARGTPRRRRIVRAEFVGATAAGIAPGLLILVNGHGVWILLGLWLLGIGSNYLALALYAHRLSQPGALEAELAGTRPRQELRTATGTQLWIVVPFSLCAAAIAAHRAPARHPLRTDFPTSPIPQGGPMFVFMSLHYPSPEHAADLVRGMSQMRDWMEGQPGCLGVDPPLLSEDATCVVGYSKWESKEAFLATGIDLDGLNDTPPTETRRRQPYFLNTPSNLNA